MEKDTKTTKTEETSGSRLKKNNTFKRFRSTYIYSENAKTFQWQGRQKAMDKVSITDKEAYSPVSKDVINLARAKGKTGGEGIYDFADGRDTGIRPYRDIGADPVEMQEAINKIKDKATKKAQEAIEKEKGIQTQIEDAKRITEAIQGSQGQ